MDNDKVRREYYETHIADVGLEISQARYWRSLLFDSEYGERYLIDKDMIDEIPEYVKHIFLEYNLKFYISKVQESVEEFGPKMVTFKFEAAEYPDITAYSRNNSNVI